MKQRKWMSILLIVMLVVSMIPRAGIMVSAAEIQVNIDTQETETQVTETVGDSETEQETENKNTEDQQPDEEETGLASNEVEKLEETKESDGVTEIPEDGENPEEQETENKEEEKKSADSYGLENPEKIEEMTGTDKTDGSEETESVELMEETEIGIDRKTAEDIESLITYANDDIASDVSGDIVWVIDKNGKLTVSGTGDFSTSHIMGTSWFDYERVPWWSYCSSIISAEIHVTNMTDASCMFYDCSNLKSLDLSNFDTANVTNMQNMFKGCNYLTNLDLSNFNTSKVKNMGGMFSDCSNLTDLNLSNFDTTKVTDMTGMFQGCENLISLDLSNFDTSNVTEMGYMFNFCESLIDLNLSSFSTLNVTDMEAMFQCCENLTGLDLSNFDTSNVTTMSNMFTDCCSLNSLNLSSFNTSKVKTMKSMFEGSKINNLDLSSFNTSKVTDVDSMFFLCDIEVLDLSSFDMSNVSADRNYYMFATSGIDVIHAPCNVKMAIALPAIGDGMSWYLPDGTEITELPQNLDHSVMITRRRNPQIITTTSDLNMDDVVRVKYVPYSYTIETNNNEEDNKVTFSIEEGVLAEGLQIYPATGEIYGVPLETGEFPITVKAEFSNPEYLPSYADLMLTVLDNTDGNVLEASDQGYEVEQYIGTYLSSDSDTYSGYTVTEDADQLFISAGSYNGFVDFWLNGQKLVDGEDYTKENGSTRITIRKQTLEGKADQDGINTIAAEFRVNGDRNNDLKRTAQNFCIDIQQREDNNSGSGSSGSSHRSNHSSGGQSEAVVSYSATSVVRLVDRSGNPLPDTILELHSTPQEARTDQNGIAVFSVVESGAHALYAKDGNGNVLASRNFELLFGDTVGINGDQLTVKAGTAFTLNVRVNGNELEFLSLQNGDIYQVIASATGDESSPEMWFLLSMLSVSAILGGVLYGRRSRYTVQ